MSDIVTDPEAFPLAFEAALNNGDLKRIVALYEEEAVLRDASGEIQAGASAVSAEMGQLIAAQAAIKNQLRHTFRHGDTALIIVDYVLRLRGPNGSPLTMDGTAINVIRHQPETGWRLIIANPHGTE